MKRIISSIIALVMVLTFCVGTMASCNVGDVNVNVNGGPAGNDEVVIPEEGFDTTKPVTITFYHQMGAALQEILNSAIADFNELYPNITVEHSSYGDYNGIRDQIKTEISVGNQPNLAYCYPDHIALYNIAGAVQTLDSLIDGQYGFTAEQKADFVPAYYNEGKAFGDGKMYSLPISKSTEVLYYNETFFKEHNLTVPKTWDEMEA
ncbi:MAG: extracellular solute-binding protein, partial [Clostridia bacterium]|nr:extracellular solute-binding protein [Clostridia bacterium]